MRGLIKFMKFVSLALVLFLVSCSYQPILERDGNYRTALLPVKVNWTKSGFHVDSKGRSTRQSNERIHRVAFRFFPKDGSAPFEEYIGDGFSIDEGYIPVQVGTYSVIVMNESVSDIYWQGDPLSGYYESVAFHDVDDYDNFSASVTTFANAPSGYFLEEYAKRGQHLFMQPPLRLASWSLDDFEVTENMLTYTREGEHAVELTPREKYMLNALTHDYPPTYDDEGNIEDTDGIDMRPLTKMVQVSLRVRNLSSAANVYGALDGFVNKVNMKTGIGFREPQDKRMLQYFTFNGRSEWKTPEGDEMASGWQPVGENVYENYVGETSRTFLSFGRDFDLGDEESYALDIDFLYITGEIEDADREYKIDTPSGKEIVTVPIDVTQQVLQSSESELEADLDISIHIETLDIDYKTGDISVADWGDETIVPLG